METIHVEERRLLLKALRRVRITDPSVLTGGPEPATPAQLDELEMVLADDQLRLIVKPEEQTFELQLSVTVLATSREEAKAAISTAIEEGREMLDEQLVDWRVTGISPVPRTVSPKTPTPAPPVPIAAPRASNTAIPGRLPECSLLRNERGEANPRMCAICGLGPCQHPGRPRPPIEPLSFDPGANWSPLR